MDHLRAHLAMRLERGSDDRVHGVLPLSPRCRHGDGSLSIGAVATMADVAVVSGTHSDRFEGGVVTSHLSLRLFGSPTGSALWAESSVVRVGRSGIVARAHIYGDDREVVGIVTAGSTALAGNGASHRRDPDRVNDMFVHRATPATGPCMDDYMGLQRAGTEGALLVYRLPFHERLRNVNSVLHGGGACLVIEQAARLAAADRGLSLAPIDELDVHFLVPGIAGPFTATVEIVPGRGPRRAMVVEVLDDGRDGRRVAFGVAAASVLDGS